MISHTRSQHISGKHADYANADNHTFSGLENTSRKSSNGIPATAGLYTVRVALNRPEVVIVVVAFTMVFIESSSAMLIRRPP